MPQSGQPHRYDNLTLLRVIAVAGVFIAHLAQKLEITGHLRSVTDLGSLCVELFLMLGGFFAISYFDINHSPHNVLRYYLKRIFRLLPLYYLIILYFYITESFVFHAVPKDPTGLRWLRYLFLLAGNIRSGDSNFDFWTNLGSTWTVCVFATFYFLMPLLYKLARNYRCSVMLLGFSWALRTVLETTNFAYLRTLQYLIFFVAGFVLWYGEKEHKHSVTLCLIALALMFHIAFRRTILEFNELILATIAYMIMAIASFPMRIHHPIVQKVLRIVDRYSYTLYLGQGIIFCGVIDKFAQNWSKPLIFSVSVFGTAALCYVIHNFYEKPVQNWGNRFILRVMENFKCPTSM